MNDERPAVQLRRRVHAPGLPRDEIEVFEADGCDLRTDLGELGFLRAAPKRTGPEVTTRPDAVAVALVEQLASLDDDTLRPLAKRFEAVLDRRLPEVETDGWMTTHEAARYLDLSVHAIHRLSAERAIPCSQDRPGARLYFKRSALDRWRAGQAR